MTPSIDPARDKHHRVPGEIISHGGWLYYRLPWSYRDVQELRFARGSDVTHEAIRQWCRKCGQDYANRLRRRRPQPGNTWYVDEVFWAVNGKRHDLWLAMDQADSVLDILVRSRPDNRVAKTLFQKLLKGLRYVPRVIITDKLQSYSAAKGDILPGVEHRQSRSLNHCCKHAPRPTRQREHRMQGFKSARHAQRFLSVYEQHLENVRRTEVFPSYNDGRLRHVSGNHCVLNVAGSAYGAIAQHFREVGRNHRHKASHLSTGSVNIASGKCLLLPGGLIIPNNLTMPLLESLS